MTREFSWNCNTLIDMHLQHEKQSPTGKNLFFSLGSFLKLYFKNEKTWSSMTTIMVFSPKIRAPFHNFWKRAEVTLLSYAPEISRIMLKCKSSNNFIEPLELSFPCQTCISHHDCQKYFKLIMSKKLENRFAS